MDNEIDILNIGQDRGPVIVENPDKFDELEDLFIPDTEDKVGNEWASYYGRLPDDVMVLSDPLGIPLNTVEAHDPWGSVVDLLETTRQMNRFSQKFGRYHDIKRHLEEGFESVDGRAGVTPWMYEGQINEFKNQISEMRTERLDDTVSVIPQICSILSTKNYGRIESLPEINYAFWTGGSYGVKNSVAYHIPETHDLYPKSLQLMCQEILEDSF